MTTNPEVTDPGLTREDQAEAFARTVIAGHPQAAVRRILLYTIVGLAFTLGIALGGLLGVALGGLGLVALLLLAMTDQLA